MFYSLDGIEYVAHEDFTIKLVREKLVPVVDYKFVVNSQKDDIVLDGESSYDPEAEFYTEIIVCKWTCPEAFHSLCTEHNDCVL